MSAHTRGPLHAADSGVLMDAHGRALAILGGIGFDGGEMMGNAHRLAACWNACEGLADPSAVPALVEALVSCEHLAERDARETCGTEFGGASRRRLDMIRAALRRARGEA